MSAPQKSHVRSLDDADPHLGHFMADHVSQADFSLAMIKTFNLTDGSDAFVFLLWRWNGRTLWSTARAINSPEGANYR